MNYTQLTAAIKEYLMVEYAGDGAEPTFVANIPNFVRHTENLINNAVQLPAFRKNVTGTFTANFQYIDVPTDFLSMFSLAVIDDSSNYVYLLNKDVNYIREAFPYPGTKGLPTHYALFDNTAFIVGPTPDKSYTAELHYYAYPQSIVTAGTSWVGTNFPNALLWGSLTEASLFLKGESEVVQAWQQKFQEALAEMKQLGDGKNRQDNYRTVQVRDRVT